LDLAGAAREFEIALRSLPNDPELLTFLGRVQREQGKWPEALAKLEKAAALDPNSPNRWDFVFATNLRLRRYPEALRAIDRQIALTPNSWRCEWLRASLMQAWKADLSAFQHLRPQTESEREGHVRLWFNTLLNLRRLDAAEEVVRNDPREIMPSALGPAPKSYFLGYVYVAKKDAQKARAFFETALPIMERAVTESPLDAQQHMALAGVYSQLHRKEDAIREAKRACELMPETKNALQGVDMLTDMALLYMEVGEMELGLPLLEHSLSVPGGAHVGTLRTSANWEPFSSDPRFKSLLAAHEPRG